MKNIKTWAIAIVLLVSISSCNSDTESDSGIRDYALQYAEDSANIENYLKTNSVTVLNNPGFADDQNATFTAVPNLDSESIWGSNPLTPKASLLFKDVTVGGVVHKIYYLKFREGVGVSPTSNSQITAYYNGFLLNNSVFETSNSFGATFPLNQFINGWKAIFPEFKMGTISATGQFEDFGAGVMFLPSALAYYNFGSGNGVIPPYTPIAFNFKLLNVN